MNDNKLHNVFKSTECLPQEKILDYVNDRLSPEERHVVERHQLDCNLCSDMIAGLEMLKEQDPGYAGRIAHLQNQVVAESTTRRRGGFVWFSAAASIVLLLGAGWWFWLREDPNNRYDLLAETETAAPSDDAEELPAAEPAEEEVATDESKALLRDKKPEPPVQKLEEKEFAAVEDASNVMPEPVPAPVEEPDEIEYELAATTQNESVDDLANFDLDDEVAEVAPKPDRALFAPAGNANGVNALDSTSADYKYTWSQGKTNTTDLAYGTEVDNQLKDLKDESEFRENNRKLGDQLLFNKEAERKREELVAAEAAKKQAEIVRMSEEKSRYQEAEKVSLDQEVAVAAEEVEAEVGVAEYDMAASPDPVPASTTIQPNSATNNLFVTPTDENLGSNTFQSGSAPISTSGTITLPDSVIQDYAIHHNSANRLEELNMPEQQKAPVVTEQSLKEVAVVSDSRRVGRTARKLKAKAEAEAPTSNPKEAGKRLFQRENYKQATTQLTEAVKQQPNDLEARYYLAQSLLASGKASRALSEYDKVVRSGTTGTWYNPARLGKAKALIALDRKSEARTLLQSLANAGVGESTEARKLLQQLD